MSDFELCAGSLPVCLGMVDFDCCGVTNMLPLQQHLKILSLFKCQHFHQLLTVMVKAQLIIFIYLEVLYGHWK